MKKNILAAHGKRFTFYTILRNIDVGSLVKSVNVGIWYEREMLEFIFKRYGTGGIYIDIGANLGTHTLWFSQICKAEMVYSFEPQKALFDTMLTTMRENKCKNIKAYNCGVGSFERSMIADGGGYPLMYDGAGETVPIVPLNHYLDASEKVKLIKIDTDGMEEEIIKSILPIIERDKPVMAIESCMHNHYKAISDMLVPIGYSSIAMFNASPTYIWQVIPEFTQKQRN